MSIQSLTGLETLTRLVGKRRNLTSSAVSSSSSNSEVRPKHFCGEVQESSIEHVEQKSYNSWVQCPVCSRSIRADIINIHIDACLRGESKSTCKKRKQLTISQFSNSTRSSGPSRACPGAQQGMDTADKQSRTKCLTPEDSVDSEHIGPQLTQSFGNCGIDKMIKGPKVHIHEKEDVRYCLPIITESDIGLSPVAMKEEVHLPLKCSTLLHGVSVLTEPDKLLSDAGQTDKFEDSAVCQGLEYCLCQCHTSNVNAKTESFLEGEVYYEGEHDSGTGSARFEKTLSPSRKNSELKDPEHACSEGASPDDPLLEILHTSIVGRRYNRRTTCKQGMKITVLREADNPNDPNAIKVVEMDNPVSLKLGHLPREISLHLSSLLERGYLKVWGSVTALPDQAFGAVPIELFCETVMAREAFLKLDGAEDSLRKAVMASKTSDPPKRSSGGVSKYQQNFSFMLQTVLERDSHLFTNEEKNFLGKYSSLSDDSQRLFIRLYQRKGPWFRLSALDYKDVTNISSASTELLDAGYMTAEDCMDENPEVPLRKKFEILNVMELRQLVCVTMMKKKAEAASAKKDDLVNMAVAVGVQKHWNLISDSPNESCSNIIQVLAEMSGPCIRVSDRADFLLWRVKRLFFLNGETDFSSFLVVDMGLMKYPRFKIWREKKIFETRGALLEYEQALEVAQRMVVALDKNDTWTALKLLAKGRQEMTLIDDSCPTPAGRIPTFLARFSASYVYRQVCTLGISILERERRYLEAIDVLRQLLSKKTTKSGRWGHWTVRLSVDLDHLGRKEESLQVAEMGASDPWIRGGDRVALQRRVVRLGKPPRRWKAPSYAAALKKTCKEMQIQGRPLNSEMGVRSWFYGYDGQQCRVEELALQHYASELGGGWRGLHCEGGVWMTLFGILMWDVLFADIPDVFQTSFQAAPLDLDTEVFFPARQNLIEAKLAVIAQGDPSSLLAQTWSENLGTLCRGVNWERYSLEQLQEIAICIGGPRLSAICKLLAEDYAGWTAGMPDLLLWRMIETGKSRHPTEDGRQLTSLCPACGCSPSIGSLDVRESHKRPSETFPISPAEQQRHDRGADAQPHRKIDGALQVPVKDNLCGEAKLAEVKGPRDRLSEQQRAWIWILMNAGLDVEVCKVVESPIE